MKDTDKKPGMPLWCRILLLLIAILAVLAFLVLGTPRASQIAMQSSDAENQAILQLVGKLSNSMLTPDGKIPEQSTIELTSEEVTTLLHTGIRAYQLDAEAGDPVLYGAMTPEGITLEASCPIGCGLACNVRTCVIPGWKDGKLTLDFSSARAGWLPIPSGMLSSTADTLLKQLEQSPEYQAISQVILDAKLQPETGKLSITFVPRKISTLIALLLMH